MKTVLNACSHTPIGVDAIWKKTNLGYSTVRSSLSILQARGLVASRFEPGKKIGRLWFRVQPAQPKKLLNFRVYSGDRFLFHARGKSAGQVAAAINWRRVGASQPKIENMRVVAETEELI